MHSSYDGGGDSDGGGRDLEFLGGKFTVRLMVGGGRRAAGAARDTVALWPA